MFCSASSLQENDRAPFGSQTLTISTHIPMTKFLALPEDQQGVYIDKVHNRMRETLQLRCPDWSEQVYFALTASRTTFERFTLAPKVWSAAFLKTKGWHHYKHLAPKLIAPNFYLVGDSVFPGQSTLATATGGHRIAESIWRRAQETVPLNYKLNPNNTSSAV